MIFTIGHSTRPLEDFVAMLKRHGIERLADVRTVPRSAHNPQYNREWLPAALAQAGIAYVHLPALGGLRHSRKDSINTGFRNASFRGYADYMQTPEFAAAVDGLVTLGASEPTAIMCAEAVPWRCHRSLVGDALLVRGVRVLDIMTEKDARQHSMTRFAKAEGTRVTYPPEEEPTE